MAVVCRTRSETRETAGEVLGRAGGLAEKLVAPIRVEDVDDLLAGAVGATVNKLPLPVVPPTAAAGKGRGDTPHVAAGRGAAEFERDLPHAIEDLNVGDGPVQIAGEWVEGVDSALR